MKKILVSGILIVFLISFAAAISFTSSDKHAINECKKNCTFEKKYEIKECNSIYRECRQDCNDHQCHKTCSDERKNCIKEKKENSRQCIQSCPYIILNISITCSYNNQTYNAGERFLYECDTCQCSYNGIVQCRQSPACNFNNFTISREYCESNNGFYYQLCTGPYFGIKCTQNYFCMCNGNNNYSCPNDYVCITNFKFEEVQSRNPLWKDLLGNKLGNIGICAKKPFIITCGNNICDNILNNQSTAETSLNCPEDCLASL